MTTKPEEKLCFVVGPIGIAGTDTRKHADMMLNAVIREVLGKDPFGMRVKRADEDADPGMIGDRVLTDVMHADLVVADLTDLNPNAFYELGIRHAAQKPTIHMAREGTLLPFDNLAHRTIFVDVSDWKSILNAREALSQSAEVVLARGYKVNNPVTQANASFKMRSSSDPTEQILGTLQSRVEALETNRLKNMRWGAPVLPDTSDDFSKFIAFQSDVVAEVGIASTSTKGAIAIIRSVAARHDVKLGSITTHPGGNVRVALEDGRNFTVKAI